MATEPTPDPPRAAADLARRVYAASHLTGSFVLRSGATSNEYFDKYRFESDPRLLWELAEAMAGLVPEGADGPAGLERGGGPRAGRPAPRGRGRPARTRARRGPPGHRPVPGDRPPGRVRAQAGQALRHPPPGRGLRRRGPAPGRGRGGGQLRGRR